jgi:hypothetical protein
MKTRGISIALPLAALSIAMWASDASAQSPGWAAAAAKCRAQGRAQYPTARESEGMRGARARAYQACLAALAIVLSPTARKHRGAAMLSSEPVR